MRQPPPPPLEMPALLPDPAADRSASHLLLLLRPQTHLWCPDDELVLQQLPRSRTPLVTVRIAAQQSKATSQREQISA